MSPQGAGLLELLSAEGEAVEVSPGRYEVLAPDDCGEEPRFDRITVIVSPEEWAELVRSGHVRDDYFGEILGPRDDDELFVVYYRGRLHRSIREELPPVAGSAFRRLVERAGPDAGWHA